MERIQHISLINPDKVLMPPLNIKLELMKNSVKAMEKHSLNSFEFLCKNFFETKPSQFKRRNLCRFTNSESFKNPEFEKTLNT